MYTCLLCRFCCASSTFNNDLFIVVRFCCSFESLSQCWEFLVLMKYHGYFMIWMIYIMIFFCFSSKWSTRCRRLYKRTTKWRGRRPHKLPGRWGESVWLRGKRQRCRVPEFTQQHQLWWWSGLWLPQRLGTEVWKTRWYVWRGRRWILDLFPVFF